MRLVTWNLEFDKAAAVWPSLQSALGADIVLLQETRRPDWRGALAWEKVAGQDWGSAVLTTKGTICSLPIEGFEGWVTGGELIDTGWNVADRPLFVFSIHAPTRTPRRPYEEEVISMLGKIEQQLPSDVDLILGGDFNFTLGERKESESRKTTPKERKALAHIARFGLVSCWTTTHPQRPLAQTLRWSKDPTPDRSTPYHCDGIFAPQSWCSQVFCEVLTSACFEISDHYPVAAWISR